MDSDSKYAGPSTHTPVLSVENSSCKNKVIVLIDVDQFEVQVHQKSWMINEKPPRVVVNAGNRIVAVSYEAKEFGIDRNDETFNRAQRKCPRLVKIPIPSRQGTNRSDSSIALLESAKIVWTITGFLSQKYPLAIFELASNDEFYIDLTRVVDDYISKTPWHEILLQFLNGWVSACFYNGYPEWNTNYAHEYYQTTVSWISEKCENQLNYEDWQQIRMLIGSNIAKEIVDRVREFTNLDCSAGIGFNKLIAKIASGLHKPLGMTVVTPNGIDQFASLVRLNNVKGFGGKIGDAILSYFPGSTMLSCQKIDLILLKQIIQTATPNQRALDTAVNLKNAVFGICKEPVVAKSYYNGCNVERNLNGKGDCKGGNSFSKLWGIIDEQCDEMFDRICFERIANNRIAKLLHFQLKFNTQSTITAQIDIPEDADPSPAKLKFTVAFSKCYTPVDAKSIRISASF